MGPPGAPSRRSACTAPPPPAPRPARAAPWGRPRGGRCQKPLPVITKCNMCAERLRRGEGPACVAACPMQALQFGTRPAMLAEAARRIAGDRRDIPALYGAEGGGGGSVLYLARGAA